MNTRLNPLLTLVLAQTGNNCHCHNRSCPVMREGLLLQCEQFGAQLPADFAA